MDLTLHPFAIWPPPKQIDWMGAKSTDAVLLGIIADRTGNPSPRTETVAPNAIMIPTDTVLKRSNSDSGNHVILPNNRPRRTLLFLQDNSPHGELWLSQEFIPTLQTMGEWRVFIVNGHIIHAIHTYKAASGHGWIARPATLFWSLNDIQ